MQRAIIISALVAGLAQSAAAQSPWHDDFDSYPLGTVLNNIGGWTGWANLIQNAGIVTDTFAFSAPHSIQANPLLGGPVHAFSGFTSGQWRMTLMQYLPSTFTNDQAYVVINNIYQFPGINQWAVRMFCDPALGKVFDALRPEANDIDIAYDRWVEIHFEIDLDSDTIDTYYDGTLLSTGQYAIGGGPTEIANINFWTDRFATSPAYYDDIRLDDACYPDCDVSTGAGVLDIFDFLCFQNSFVAGEPYACDCVVTPTPICDIFDFLCFQTAFVAGCP